MTDRELAEHFFNRLALRGFKLNFNTEAYGPDSGLLSIELLNADEKVFCSFDFGEDGRFYRISGYTSGYWQDEVDWVKY